MLRRSVVIAAPRRVEVVEEALPLGRPGQLLVRAEVSAISPGTEMLFYRGQVPADMSVDATLGALAGAAVQYPLRYGYSCVGRVVDVISPADSHWLERRVFAFVPHASYFWVTPDEVLIAPHELSAARVTFLPNMETAVNLVMDGHPGIGERVAVVGQGVVGLLTLALLRQFPLQQLTGVDPIGLRRSAALRLGADSAIRLDDARAPGGWESADLVYELSGSPAALNTALALIGFAGRVVIGSWYGQKQAPINFGGAFHRSRVRLIASQVSTIDPQWSGRWDKGRRFAWAWQMLQQLPIDFLVTHRFPIAEAATAYQTIDEHPETTIHQTRSRRLYTLAVKRSFIAQHYLVGGDWGPENNWHSHHYQLELVLEGETLDHHGYLVDIVDVEHNLEAIVTYYRDKTLNELPEFAGLNPSIEHFTRIACQALARRLQQVNTLTAISIRIWENEIAWAAYRQVLTQVSPQTFQP